MFRSRGKWSVKENLPSFGQRVDASFLAGLVGMTRQHVTRLCRAGKIPSAYQSTGGHWRFRWSGDLYAWTKETLSKGGALGALGAEVNARRAQQIDDAILTCEELTKLLRIKALKLRKQLKRCPPDAVGLATLRNVDRFLSR